MKIVLFAITLLSLSFPAQAQSPVMTNDDVGNVSLARASLSGVLKREGGYVIPLAVTKEALSAFSTKWTANDKEAMDEMFEAGECMRISSGARARLLAEDRMNPPGREYAIIKVRVTDGKHAGQEGWTYKEFLVVGGEDDYKDETVNGMNKAIKLGDRVNIVSSISSSTLYLFVTEQAFKDVVAEGQRRDGLISQMLATGAVFEVPAGTIGVVNELRNILINGRWWAVALVRIDRGRFAGKAGWVYQQEVKRAL